MEDQQKQLVAKLKDAQNVLVTVSKNPSVDQLAAAIGLTLALNKLDKHATAVYSGQTPSTIEFLKPEETLETNTDSLRDFIIALDKSKADKLRYKVEDQVVRIFITPYRTSISENDLEFSQGDFNVDVVVALGVKEQVDLDDAIEAHGRILHDATVSSIAIEGQPELGTLNIVNPEASSLCEVVTKLISQLDKEILDSQIATALLTGIVAMTDRFSNDRTTPNTMSLSANLMAAGANQQLIANELAEPAKPAAQTEVYSEDVATVPVKDPGTLEIEHSQDLATQPSQDEEIRNILAEEPDKAASEGEGQDDTQIHVDDDGRLMLAPEKAAEETMIGKAKAVGDMPTPEAHDEPQVTRERIIEPPSRAGELTANVKEEDLDASTEELTLPTLDAPLLSHTDTVLSQPDLAAPAPAPQEVFTPTPIDTSLDDPSSTQAVLDTAQPGGSADDVAEIDTEEQTLTEIEEEVGSPHVHAQAGSAKNEDNIVEDARSAVEAAFAAGSNNAPQDPIAALNAQPLGPELHTPEAAQRVYQPAPGFGDVSQVSGSQSPFATEPLPGGSPADQTLDMPVPSVAAGVTAPPSVFPGSMPQQDSSAPPPPPVPPPPVFPAT